MKKKRVVMLLILVILLTMSMLSYSINASRNSEDNNKTDEGKEKIDDTTVMKNGEEVTIANNSFDLEAIDVNECDSEDCQSECEEEGQGECEEECENEETEDSYNNLDEKDKDTKNVNEEESSSENEYTEEELNEIENQLINIIEAFAKHYKISNYEAAELIYNMMQLTLEQGGIVEFDEKGSLIFDNRVTIEVLYSGRILINGFDIIQEQAEEYNLTYEDSVEVINALFELTLTDSHFTIQNSDENGVLFVYSIITEITVDGVMIIDGQVIDNGDIDDTIEDIVEEAEELDENSDKEETYIDPGENLEDLSKNVDKDNNSIKASNNKNNEVKMVNSVDESELPKTGEELKIAVYIIGGILVLIGNVILLKRLRKDL